MGGVMHFLARRASIRTVTTPIHLAAAGKLATTFESGNFAAAPTSERDSACRPLDSRANSRNGNGTPSEHRRAPTSPASASARASTLGGFAHSQARTSRGSIRASNARLFRMLAVGRPKREVDMDPDAAMTVNTIDASREESPLWANRLDSRTCWSPWTSRRPERCDRARRSASRRLRAFDARTRDPGPDAELQELSQHPFLEVGSRGQNPRRGLILGSTSTQLPGRPGVRC